MPKPLGSTHESVLRHLRDHGFWHPTCGWTWGTAKATERLLESLAKRGLAYKGKTPNGRDCYLPGGPTDA